MSSRRGGGGGGEGGGRGKRWNFEIFPKIAVKFPTPGQKCEVKYNWNSPPQEMICDHGHEQKFKYPYSRDSKIIQMPYPRAEAIDQIPALCPRRFYSTLMGALVWILLAKFILVSVVGLEGTR